MPTPIAPRIILAQNARVELQTLARAHSTPQSLALRARMVLRAAAVDQPTNLQIGRELGCSNLTVGKWRRRYLELGFPGLQDARRSGRPRTIAPPTRVQVISVASALPQDQHRTVTQVDAGMRLWRPYLTPLTPLPSAAPVSGVSCTTSISSLTRVSTGSIATMRTLMPRPATSATCTPRRLRPITKVAW